MSMWNSLLGGTCFSTVSDCALCFIQQMRHKSKGSQTPSLPPVPHRVWICRTPTICSSSNSSCCWNRAHIRRASIIFETLQSWEVWAGLGRLSRTRSRILSMLCILHVAVVGDNNSNKSDDNNNMAAKAIRHTQRMELPGSVSLRLPRPAASCSLLLPPVTSCYLLLTPASSCFLLLLLVTWAQPLQKLVATRCCSTCTFFDIFFLCFPTSILTTLKDRRLR